MAENRILVVYYSRTGHTRALAEWLAERLDADVERLLDDVDRSGVRGFLRSARDALRARLVHLHPLGHDPSRYDAVVVATPVWSLSLSSPVRSFLEMNRDRLRGVAFVVACGGRGAQRVLGQMVEAATKVPLASLVVRDRDLGAEELPARLSAFAAKLGRPSLLPRMRAEPAAVATTSPH